MRIYSIRLGRQVGWPSAAKLAGVLSGLGRYAILNEEGMRVEVLCFSCSDCGKSVELSVSVEARENDTVREYVCYNCGVIRKHERAMALINAIFSEDSEVD